MQRESLAASVSDDRMAEIRDALAAFGYRLVANPARVANSIVNENYRVETDRGSLFVRFHPQTRSTSRLQREHRAILWASEHSLPVAVPLRSKRGDSLVEVNGRVVAVFPWINGRPLKRGQVSVDQAAAMGQTHGRLHAEFSRYQDSDLPWFWDTWKRNVEDSAERFREHLQELPTLDLHSHERDVIQRCLERQVSYLRTERPLEPPDAGRPGAQPVHGDFHERNVLFDDANQVVGVVDWDIFLRMPRAFELVRCLSLAQLFEPDLLEAYLGAYHEHVTLLPEECSQAVELWWQYNLRDLWLSRRRLIQGDQAVQPFFAEHIEFMARFGDPAFRVHLTAELQRLAG